MLRYLVTWDEDSADIKRIRTRATLTRITCAETILVFRMSVYLKTSERISRVLHECVLSHELLLHRARSRRASFPPSSHHKSFFAPASRIDIKLNRTLTSAPNIPLLFRDAGDVCDATSELCACNAVDRADT